MAKRLIKHSPHKKEHEHKVAELERHQPLIPEADAPKKRRWSKKKLLFSVGGLLLVLVVVGSLLYYSFPMKAETRELNAAKNLMTVRYDDKGHAIVLEPLGGAKKAILLYPGGRVDPAAYAYKMSNIAQAGVAVVIVRPPLHLAPFDWRPIAAYTDLVPTVPEWYVAGHSVGGVKACQVAADNSPFKGLILLAAYCAGNVSGLGMPVLSIGGSNDKHTTPDDIDRSKPNLPQNTTYEMIEGLNHAGFGDYGAQSGDGDMAAADDDIVQKLTLLITRFIGMNNP